MILCKKKDRNLRKIEKIWQLNFGGGRYTASPPPLTPGEALCARRLFNTIFLQVSVKDHGLKLSDF